MPLQSSNGTHVTDSGCKPSRETRSRDDKKITNKNLAVGSHDVRNVHLVLGRCLADAAMPLTDAMVPALAATPKNNGLVIRAEAPEASETSEAPEAPETDSLPQHPLGIRPLGNKYLASEQDAKLQAGTFQILPDETILQLVEWLNAASLAVLGRTCRFLYAVCDYDDLWKTRVLEEEGGRLADWQGTWRLSLAATRKDSPKPKRRMPRIDCSAVFSDVLHRPFVCSNVEPARFAADIPAANQICRLPDLDHRTFAEKWSDTPFILTDCVRAWPVMRDWSLDRLCTAYADTLFRAEAVDWPYARYDRYMQDTADESPLYLFDRGFVEKMGIQADTDYWRPDCFGADLFAVLGDERPAHRWLIIGPARSGSTFHKDPNATSAWNAVVQGAKYWVMFPPGATVPGVFVSRDKSEVTSPLSIAEWLLTFHAEARRQPGCLEGVCRAGEILHVPSGWWHLVVNLEAGIAVTQNFVSPAHLADVLLFLRDRPEQVTGFARETVADPYELFVERLTAGEHAEELQTAQAEMERRDGRRKRTWEAVVGESEKRQRTGEGGGFTFGFGDLEDEDEPNGQENMENMKRD